MTRAIVLSCLVGVGVLSITLSAHQAQQAQQKAPPALPELTGVKENFYQLASAQAAKKAGQSAEAAAKAINLTAKYRGYTSKRMGPAIQALYADLP